MSVLVLGVIIWSGIHLMPSAARAVRQRLITAFGEKAYTGIVAVFIISSIALMVIG
ncbi:MAG: NnrU family protein [Lysobacterales bacterium]